MINTEESRTAEQFFANTGLITYLSIMAISISAGVVSYFEKRQKFAWRTFFVHLLSASFAGMMTFFGCEAFGITGPLTGVLCGASAHMGTPALIAWAKKSELVQRILGEEIKKK